MNNAQFAPIPPSVVNTVSAASLTVLATTAPSAPASLSSISKRALKGKKNPPGSRNQQKKAHKAAVASALAGTSARAASLSTELAETNRLLADAVEARDSARSAHSRSAAKAEEWKHKYRVIEDAATRDRLAAVSSRLLEAQRAQNLHCSSGSLPVDCKDRVPSSACSTLPAPSSLIPSPYPGRAPLPASSSLPLFP